MKRSILMSLAAVLILVLSGCTSSMSEYGLYTENGEMEPPTTVLDESVPLRNLVAGRPYTIDPEGDQIYANFPDADPPKLTDGKLLPVGTAYTSGHDYLIAIRRPGAVGVEAGIIFALGGMEKVSQVNVGTYAHHMSTYSFYYPDMIRISVSADGEDWTEVMQWRTPIARNEQENGSRWFKIPLPFPVEAAFVRLDFESLPGTSLFFLDEIEILGPNFNAPRDTETIDGELFGSDVPIAVDVLVAGGGTGGTSAAYQAARAGFTVLVIEPTHWIGGQITAQGVSCLDEHGYIEKSGGTRSYYAFREGVRNYYKDNFQLSSKGMNMSPFNPGGGVALAFEPRVGLEILYQMLNPYLEAGNLRIETRSAVVSVERDENNRISAAAVRHLDTGETFTVQPKIVIDATELGDIMPLAGIPYTSGMESFAETGEPSAPEAGNQEAVQGFTYTFALEYRPGENHVIPKPEGYEENKRYYSYRGYTMFTSDNQFGRPLWEYRRIIAADNFDDEAYPYDITIINWAANDYTGGNIIDAPPEKVEQYLNEAKQLSLGLVYWLQTEAPRDEGGYGYPELMLRPDVLGSEDGLSQFPYIRESRRLDALVKIHEEDIVVKYNPGTRARLWPDSVGIGMYYYVDIHASANTTLRPGSGQRVRPFQVPLRAMLTGNAPNFVAGAKNIGMTHISNGAYRLHPVEWNIGESAGALAAFALSHNIDPLQVGFDRQLQIRFQKYLVNNGIPVYWFNDVHPTDAWFEAVQFLGQMRIIDDEALAFNPNNRITESTASKWSENAGVTVTPKQGETRAEYAQRLYEEVVRVWRL
ncbi:MAG TPA: FAD-dependent oxidoreductase [Firmicutes bacterium]|nr:FAD-dependent oxidoreductase [Bacillota bacterium]